MQTHLWSHVPGGRSLSFLPFSAEVVGVPSIDARAAARRARTTGEEIRLLAGSSTVGVRLAPL